MKGNDVTRRWYVIAACLAACFLAPGFSTAGEPKFGVIDMDSLLKTSKTAKDTLENIGKVNQEVAGKINALSAGLKILEEKLDKEKAELKDSQKSERDNEIKMKREELELERQAGQFKFELTRQTMTKNFITNRDLVVADIAKDEGLTAVFNKGMVVYGPGMVDITEKAIKTLDERYAQHKATEKPSTTAAPPKAEQKPTTTTPSPAPADKKKKK